MIQTALMQNAHKDLVTDACYDMYGLHLATCGLDQRIKVWSLNESSGEWSLEDEWKAHDAAITKVTWAHASFGSIIASSSFDRTVKVWELTFSDVEQMNGAAGSSSGGSSRWKERATLVDAKGSVRAVEFAPHYFGLKIATISSDNQLRIYECLEQPALTTWQIMYEVDILSLPTHASRGLSSLSHSHAEGTPTPTHTAGGTSAAVDGQSVSNLLLSAAQQQSVAQLNAGRPGVGIKEADGGWCLSWCKDQYWGEVIAAGCSISGVVKIIQFAQPRRPVTLLSLESKSQPSPPVNPQPIGRGVGRSAGHASGSGVASANDSEVPYAITSVSWAPSCGRSFHLIATGSRDGHVRIWKVRPPTPTLNDDLDEGGDEKWSASLVAEFGDHESSVGRVEWNITGTVLSSAGNDGWVRLWKQTVGGVWRSAGTISVEQAEDTENADADMDENGE